MVNAIVLGIVGVAVSSLGWGSNFVVCKNYDMKDGIVFQFWMCTGILFIGILSLLASEHDTSSKGESGDYLAVFSLVTMSGGVLWGFGNLLTTKIISTIGLGLGMAIWGGTSTVIGFIFGRLPILGLKPSTLAIPWLAYVGIAGSVVSLIIFSFTKPDGIDSSRADASSLNNDSSSASTIEDGGSANSLMKPLVGSDDEDDAAAAAVVVGAKAAATDRIVGITCAFVAGTVYGLQFVPATIWRDHNTHGADGTPNATDDPKPWKFQTRIFFSQFVGIWLLSIVAFAVTTVVRKIRKVPNAQWELPTSFMLPSFASGIVWAFAGMGAIFATENLGLSVGYPLTLNCSFIVNSVWTLFVYREYKSKKNIILYLSAAAVNILSSIALSIGSNGV